METRNILSGNKAYITPFKEGVDYYLTFKNAGSGIAVLALHGGGIEPGTEELAREIHREGEGLFIFSGIKRSGNWVLHITSTKYDHPAALELVGKSLLSISIHGAEGKQPVTYIGGLCEKGIKAINDALEKSGFDVSTNPPEKIAGNDPRNIVNRNRRGKGVQIEISEGQRALFFKGLHSRYLRKYKTRLFYEYAKALRHGIDNAKKLIIPE